MREEAVRAVLEAVREILRVAGTISFVIQRAVAEEAVEVLSISYPMAREILAVRVLVKLVAILHRFFSCSMLILHSGARYT